MAPLKTPQKAYEHTDTHTYPQTPSYWDHDFFLQSHPAIGNDPGLAYWDIFYNLCYWELCVFVSKTQFYWELTVICVYVFYKLCYWELCVFVSKTLVYLELTVMCV